MNNRLCHNFLLMDTTILGEDLIFLLDIVYHDNGSNDAVRD